MKVEPPTAEWICNHYVDLSKESQKEFIIFLEYLLLREMIDRSKF